MNKKYVTLGAFLVITLGLLLWLAQQVGALGGGSGKHYEVRLDHAAGLVQNNAVKVAGVKVGAIEKVEVDHRTAVLTLRVDEEVELHDDAVAIVRAKSLLGEKYLQLDPGELESPLLSDGAEIVNVHATFEIDEVLNALEPILGGDASIAAAIGPLAQRVDALIASAAGDDGGAPIVNREELTKTIEDARMTVESVRRIAESNEEEIGELISNTNRLLGDPRVDRILTNLDRSSATLAKRLPGLLDRADQALASVEAVSAELSPERMQKVGQIIDDVSVATNNLKTISEEMKGVSGDVGPLVASLGKIATRAASIDELALRKFLQTEGVHVTVGNPRKAKRRLEDLESAP